MSSITDSVQQLARKALWAEVYEQAANLFERLATETSDDPLETYTALFMSSYLCGLLGDKKRSMDYQSRFRTLNEEVAQSLERTAETTRRFPNVQERVKYLTTTSGRKLNAAEIISFFVSPYAYESTLQKMLKAESKAPPSFRVGIFRYSVSARLENIVVRGYSEGTLDMNRVYESDLKIHLRSKLGVMITMPNEALGTFLIDKMGIITGDYSFVRVTERELSIIRQDVENLSKIFE